jgi:hypothetical protein
LRLRDHVLSELGVGAADLATSVKNPDLRPATNRLQRRALA